jgi:N-dimethylarginine dimethylaminohydrolase
MSTASLRGELQHQSLDEPGKLEERGSALHEEAEQQWFALHDTLLALGAAIEFVDPEHFQTSCSRPIAAIVLDGKALLARFRYPERQGEEPIFGAALRALKERAEIDTIMKMPDGVWLEGAGDCIWDPARRQFWPRSRREAAQVVAESFGTECVALELSNASFYHLDTALCPLPSGDVIYFPGALKRVARHRGVRRSRASPDNRS